MNYANQMANLEKQKVLLASDYELLRNIRVEIDALNGNISDGEEKLNKLKLVIKQQSYTLDIELSLIHI